MGMSVSKTLFDKQGQRWRVARDGENAAWQKEATVPAVPGQEEGTTSTFIKYDGAVPVEILNQYLSLTQSDYQTI